MRILLFEDEFHKILDPLVSMRAVAELRLGFHSIFEAVSKFFNSEVILYVRSYLVDVLKVRFGGLKVNCIDDFDDVLMVNSRLIPKAKNLNLISSLAAKNTPFMLFDGGEIVAVKVRGSLLEDILPKFHDGVVRSDTLKTLRGECSVYDVGGMLIKNLWDIILLNEDLIKEGFTVRGVNGELDDHTIVYGSKSNLYVGEGSRVEGNVNIDVRGGPVYIGRNVNVLGPCRIEGPSYIGDNTIILSGARIRSGSNIGFNCRVGGEVEASVLHGYVNMYHPSFVGHSYVCEWVNLAAFTVTSDLKNTYGNIRVKIGGSIVDSGLNKLGSFIGDHVKTSINCGIFAGKRIGIFSHLFGYVYEDVPPFTIYSKALVGKSYELKLESALETMRRVYLRRGRQLSPEEMGLVKYLFQSSDDERVKAGVVKGSLSII
ncbi:MAG: hypothetical protein MRT15_03065 [archaeon YNP-LCB-003-016]|uniref:putative sugar nucleotidyl transferase n=1 Tax=Candidatus Culexarchaeum yellowstonense TaxID=2928963 RepID=UPI0026F212C8|nr:putative sugar nucleotidyl transferase [Candidatus Culexarchaeum yellowstonense]MCR6691345.1 hypothetical protein [Candidatus Culexarchaeum yellowstonense]